MIRFILLMIFSPFCVAVAAGLGFAVGAPSLFTIDPCQPDLQRRSRLPIELKVLRFPGAANVVLWRPFTRVGRSVLGGFWRGIQYNQCGELRPRALYTPAEGLRSRQAQ